MARLRDPEFRFFHVFVVPHDAPREVRMLEMGSLVDNVVQNWCRALGINDTPAIERFSPRKAMQEYQLLAHVPWCEHKGALVELTVRAFLDMVYIQLGGKVAGDFDANALPEITLPQLDALKTSVCAKYYLGGVECHYAEATEAAAPAGLRLSSEQLWQCRYRGYQGHYAFAEFGGMTAGVEDRHARVCVAYLPTAEVNRELLFAVPSAFFSCLKMSNSVENIFEVHLPAAESLGARVESEIQELQGKGVSLRQLELFNHRLATIDAGLAKNAAKIDFDLGNIEINSSNLVEVLSDSGLKSSAESFVKNFCEGYRREVMQARADLRNTANWREAIRIERERIRARLELHSAIWSQRLAFFMGLLTAVSLIGVLPILFARLESYPGWIRLLIASIPCLLFIATWIILVRFPSPRLRLRR